MTYRQLCKRLESAPSADDRKRLIGEYSRTITSFFAPWCPGVIEAEDWASEVLLTHLQLCETFRDGSFYPYAYSSVRRRMHQCLRNFYSWSRDDTTARHEQEPMQTSPEHRLWCVLFLNQLKTACTDLEWQCMKLLSDGYSHQEISEITGRTLKAVDCTISRVREKAKRMYHDEL